MSPLVLDPVVDLGATLSAYRFGHRDPTTRLTNRDFWRATYTPLGPATVHIHWDANRLDAESWGPGADWILAQVPAMTGQFDPGFACPINAHPAVRRAHRNQPGLRIGASRTLYHELLPVILGQRVTGAEAVGQWHRLTAQLGHPAPGPDSDLRLPPDPASLLAKPAWWYHPYGIEAKRAEALRTVARYADRIGEWGALPAALAASKLALLRGIGPWTIGSVLGPCHGDADAVPVGDYHIPNLVSWALAGEPRGNDRRMLDLLEPYAGHRGRVILLLARDGNSAPAHGPRQRIQPMHRR